LKLLMEIRYDQGSQAYSENQSEIRNMIGPVSISVPFLPLNWIVRVS